MIEACARLKRSLIVAGTGPELAKRKTQSAKLHANVTFLEFVKSDDALRKLYAGARAFLFPQIEDFGLVAAEAIACGTPVIALGAGGAFDILEEGVNGHFFHEQTPAALAHAILEFEHMPFDRARIAATALRFSPGTFREGIRMHLPEKLRPAVS